MIRRSFFGTALLVFAPVARLLAACKPKPTGLAAVQQRLEEAHGKQLKDIPWLVWHTVEIGTGTTAQDLDAILNNDEAGRATIDHCTYYHVQWDATFDRLFTTHGLDPRHYFVECVIGSSRLSHWVYQSAESLFHFKKIWLAWEWLKHYHQLKSKASDFSDVQFIGQFWIIHDDGTMTEHTHHG